MLPIFVDLYLNFPLVSHIWKLNDAKNDDLLECRYIVYYFSVFYLIIWILIDCVVEVRDFLCIVAPVPSIVLQNFSLIIDSGVNVKTELISSLFVVLYAV